MINLVHKRKHIRINTETVAKIVHNNTVTYGLVKNISAGGALVNIQKEKFNDGDIIELYFKYKNTFYNTFGLVVRDAEENKPYGIKFVFKDESNRDAINKQVLSDYFIEFKQTAFSI